MEGQKPQEGTMSFSYRTKPTVPVLLEATTGRACRRPTYLSKELAKGVIYTIYPNVGDDLKINPPLDKVNGYVGRLELTYTGSGVFPSKIKVELMTGPEQVIQEYGIEVTGSSQAINNTVLALKEALSSHRLTLEGIIKSAKGICESLRLDSPSPQ